LLIVKLPPFQELVDAHWYDVARLAHALVGPTDADDAAQQAWTQALAAYPALTDARNLRGWLLTITRNVAMDTHRSRSRRAVPVADPPETPVGPPVDSDPTLWAAVRTLPERQRLAVVLRYVLDLDHAEISAILNTTSAASRRLVSDALATLRKEVSHD
jgi:RNA polymerase sigma factor (sigma-70 family)